MLTQALVEPPVNLLLVVGFGLALMRHTGRHALRRRLGGMIAALGFVALVVLAIPATARLLLGTLERGLVLEPAGTAPGAIVVLSADDLRAVAGGLTDPPDVGALTLERLRAGAVLHRRTGLPILVTGGVLRPGAPPIAAAMARVLAEEFATPARWVEDRSATTWENAAFSSAMLGADGITAAYVVTHAWHMRRSLLAFDRTALQATAAPTYFSGPERLDIGSFIPSAHAWADSRLAMHEWIGLAWYTIRGWR